MKITTIVLSILVVLSLFVVWVTNTDFAEQPRAMQGSGADTDGTVKKISAVAKRAHPTSLQQLKSDLSELSDPAEFLKLGTSWLARAARENPELGFRFLLEQSGTQWG